VKRKSTGRRDCDSEAAGASLYSTVHSAGPLFGPKEAKRRFTRAEMDAWLQSRGVRLVGASRGRVRVFVARTCIKFSTRTIKRVF